MEQINENYEVMKNNPPKKEKINGFATSIYCSFWLKLLIFSLVIILIRIALPFHTCRVSGNSMLPNYENGQFLLADKLRGNDCEINRYDVVVAKSDIGVLIKRVVGMPGETLEIRNDGYVYINNIKLEKLAEYQSESMDNYEILKVHLGEDEYFLMGDNVNYSSDSRILGNFSKEKIIGIVRS